jgi:hypothetical protein
MECGGVLLEVEEGSMRGESQEVEDDAGSLDIYNGRTIYLHYLYPMRSHNNRFKTRRIERREREREREGKTTKDQGLENTVRAKREKERRRWRKRRSQAPITTSLRRSSRAPREQYEQS